MTSARPRVYELAKELGLSTAEVLAQLRKLSDAAPRVASASVDPELVQQLRANLSSPGASSEPEDGRQLILAAFGQAHARGFANWRRMHAGALKNRILNLTGRQFDERKWGASTFLGFLSLFPSLVSIDRSVSPPGVDLLNADDQDIVAALRAIRASGSGAIGDQGAHEREAPSGPWRIRPDLWSSVLDYGKGEVWVWDGREATPVAAEEFDEQDTARRLPTVDENTLQEWRKQFEVAQTREHPEHAENLRAWREEGLSSWSLPPQLRNRWFEALKLNVYERLSAWFEAQGLPHPADFVQAQSRRPRRTYRAGDPATERLRELVMACVQEMTRDELEELRLPPAVLLRSQDHVADGG